MNLSKFSLAVIGLQLAFMFFLFTGQGVLAGTMLVLMVAFLVLNLVSAKLWGNQPIWRYSLYACVIPLVPSAIYLGVVEFPVLFITQELLMATVLGASVLIALGKDPVQSAGFVDDVWRA